MFPMHKVKQEVVNMMMAGVGALMMDTNSAAYVLVTDKEIK